MDTLVKALIGLAAVGFLLAVATSLTSVFFLGLPAESFSRACSNLALIGIALSIASKKGSKGE